MCLCISKKGCNALRYLWQIILLIRIKDLKKKQPSKVSLDFGLPFEKVMFGFVCFLSLMTYQPSWII